MSVTLLQPRALIRVSLGGGPRHRLAALIAAEVALEKGYAIYDTLSWRGGDAIPDLVISKPGASRRDPPTTLWVEIVDTHDPRIDWHTRGYNVLDVLTLNISRMKSKRWMNDAYEAAQRLIP